MNAKHRFRCYFEDGLPLELVAENREDAMNKARWLAEHALVRCNLSFSESRRRTKVWACDQLNLPTA